MSTTTLSDYFVVDSGDESFKVTDFVFYSRDSAEDFIRDHETGLARAKHDGLIKGIKILEVPYPAVFVLAKENGWSDNYLAFGARVIKEINHKKIIGIHKDHGKWLCMRLMSGLLLANRTHKPYETLEEALADAETIDY